MEYIQHWETVLCRNVACSWQMSQTRDVTLWTATSCVGPVTSLTSTTTLGHYRYHHHKLIFSCSSLLIKYRCNNIIWFFWNIYDRQHLILCNLSIQIKFELEIQTSDFHLERVFIRGQDILKVSIWWSSTPNDNGIDCFIGPQHFDVGKPI